MSTRQPSALVIALLAASLASAALAERSLTPAAVSPALRTFVAIDLDGNRWTAANLRGRVTLLDFWATWCAPCLSELPRLKDLRQRHSREDFEILGISLDVTSRRSLVSWLNRNRIEWPQIHERSGYSGDVARLFAIDRLPRTIVIGGDGTVAAVDVRGETLAQLVDTLVTEHRVRSASAGGQP